MLEIAVEILHMRVAARRHSDERLKVHRLEALVHRGHVLRAHNARHETRGARYKGGEWSSAYNLRFEEKVCEVHAEHCNRAAHRISVVKDAREVLPLADRLALAAGPKREEERLDARPHLVGREARNFEVAPFQVVQLCRFGLRGRVGRRVRG